MTMMMSDTDDNHDDDDDDHDDVDLNVNDYETHYGLVQTLTTRYSIWSDWNRSLSAKTS